LEGIDLLGCGSKIRFLHKELGMGHGTPAALRDLTRAHFTMGIILTIREGVRVRDRSREVDGAHP